MLKIYKIWYSELSSIKQLAFSFIFYWVFWLISSLLDEYFVFEQKRSWAYHIISAAWMAFFFTIIFNWKQTKELFSKKK